jgi:hypothetical protein
VYELISRMRVVSQRETDRATYPIFRRRTDLGVLHLVQSDAIRQLLLGLLDFPLHAKGGASPAASL